ncbi:DUF2207 domain-containing protein [Methanothermococcus okinawensis]|uniref:DUF2207 domain-containing protein n=1 Tax=Methanothermococcus okinawensis (strain DSM 14208 / JCM 11175 / IH1) TaxID=647113 RepID=F8ANN8_METOI|nr:DUF2207 domain-containing protein [Methanothermococcus okinawensis]AEH06236.1 Protein of unknown function DUF2207, membrane [Methanothermococcus okinawensis IH1]
MREEKLLIIILVIIGIIGILGVGITLNLEGQDISLSSSPINVKSYNAELILDKNISLKETYNYQINENNRYRMLYRDWKKPLICKCDIPKVGIYSNNPFINNTDDDISSPHITVINLSASNNKLIGYVVNYRGILYANTKSSEDITKLQDLIFQYHVINEVGFYNPNRYSSGDYSTSYLFNIYPPIEYDNHTSHLNLKLADEHFPYKNVNIYIVDKNNDILNLFVHPVGFKVSKTYDGYIITGHSPKNGLIELEMLLKPNAITGYYKHVNNVKEKTLSANNFYFLINNILSIIKYLFALIIIIFPLIAYIIYNKYGVEKNYIVPEYLSYVPNKNRKPWIVNLIFNGKFGKFGKEGFYATLLYLHDKKYVKILPGESNKDINIKILNKDLSNLDYYEKKVMDFLIRYSTNNIFKPSTIEKMASDYKYHKDSTGAQRLWNEVNGIIYTPTYRNYVSEYISNTGNYIIWALLACSIIVALVFFGLSFSENYNILYPDIPNISHLSLVWVIQCIVLLIAPKPLFGRWKNDYYKEKLEWDAFKNFLSNIAMIKKYGIQDINMWKDWLIYGTALGVGKNVEKALKSLDIELPENVQEMVYYYPMMYYSFGSMYSSVNMAYTATTNPSGGTTGFGGGGFGAGGGFGGGGAGAR